jgi:hypothetical protein
MAGTSGTTAPAPGGTRSRSPALYRAYHWTLGVFLVCGAIQIFLAGLGVFGGGGPGIDPHRFFALVLAGISFIAVVLAALARAGGRVIGLNVLIFVLVFLVQSFLAMWGQDESAWFGGLHALDGLIIIGLAGYLFGTSGRRPISPR